MIIRVSKKFSREFDAYLPTPQFLVRILAVNSLENFLTNLNLKSYEDVFIVVRPAYTDVNNARFHRILVNYM